MRVLIPKEGEGKAIAVCSMFGSPVPDATTGTCSPAGRGQKEMGRGQKEMGRLRPGR